MNRASILALALLAAHGAAASTEHHDLFVRIDPERGTISVSDRVRANLPGDAVFHLDAGLSLRRVEVNGVAAKAEARDGAWHLPIREPGEQRILVECSGRPGPTDGESLVTPESTVLAGNDWYPRFGADLLTYTVEVETPPAMVALAPGAIVSAEKTGRAYRARFRSEAPADDIALFAAPYAVTERRHGTERLRTYFHPEVADLAETYLRKTAEILDLYDGWIGAYPFSGFSVVSTTLPVGLGFPGLTLIGTRVLRLPFLPETSLGHEVLHSWWGGGVLIDAREGNWAEGLTTFMADYTYAEREGAAKAREMRLRWLREYGALPAPEDRPLTAFRGRSHSASQVVGYHKAAMLFLMLRDRIGRAAFDRGIRRFWQSRRFTAATWSDLQKSFEAAAEQPLDVFFSQWLRRAGAPRLALSGVRLREEGGRFRISFGLEQAEPPYSLDVPVEVRLAGSAHVERVALGSSRGDYEIRVDERPRELRVDPHQRLFRRLEESALPAILRSVAFDASAVAVVAAVGQPARGAAREVAAAFFERAVRVGEDGVLPRAGCLVVGTDAAVAALLAANGVSVPGPIAGKGTARVWATKREKGGALVVVAAGGAAALRAIARPLPHYGSQSWVVFDGRRAVDRGVWPAEETSLRARFDAGNAGASRARPNPPAHAGIATEVTT